MSDRFKMVGDFNFQELHILNGLLFFSNPSHQTKAGTKIHNLIIQICLNTCSEKWQLIEKFIVLISNAISCSIKPFYSFAKLVDQFKGFPEQS